MFLSLACLVFSHGDVVQGDVSESFWVDLRRSQRTPECGAGFSGSWIPVTAIEICTSTVRRMRLPISRDSAAIISEDDGNGGL